MKSLPKNWKILRNHFNYEVINNYFEEKTGNKKFFVKTEGYISTLALSNPYSVYGYDSSEHEEITFKQFKKYILGMDDSRFPFELSLENARKIINVACDIWKTKLVKKWSESLVMENSVTIDFPFYQTMRGECDEQQHKVFDEIFGSDKREIDLSKLKLSSNFSGPGSNIFSTASINDSLGEESLLIAIRSWGEFENKGFFLSSKFNWEIKKDDNEGLNLVPTIKKR